MIGLIDQICIYDDLVEESEEYTIVEAATMAKDFGPFRAGELVPHLQLQQYDSEDETSLVVALVEIDPEGKTVRGCTVELVAAHTFTPEEIEESNNF